jgi:hypothetical protein
MLADRFFAREPFLISAVIILERTNNRPAAADRQLDVR